MSDEYLLLKWGTLKGWGNLSGNEAAVEAWKRYHAEPVSLGVMSQRDTEAQTDALCDLIDAVNGPIENDWSGETMTKEEAKEYVRGYRR
jgi:hypothetical protein